MRKNLVLKFFISLSLCLSSFFVGYAQELNNFDVRYQNNLRGDLTFIGNHILNRDSGFAGERPNDPYNNLRNNNSWSGANNDNSGFTNYNDYKNMQYIDVDSDPTTFSSSTSTFTYPNATCNLIRYAGLYWTATYPSATANGSFDGFTYTANSVAVGTGRQTDFNQVKFRVPGGAYVDITADEILYDGFTSADNTIRQNSPYACYADVTGLVTALADPQGDYTVANIRATTGGLTPGGGSAAGWTLVIVYENPNLTGKLIATFDGFARVNGSNSIDINYSGFETIPVGPVNVDLGAGTLEGDFRITGDGLSIQAASGAGFTAIGDAANPTNNFFNSNISLDGAITTNRNPASLNTLGYDTDIFLMANPGNSIIPNGETAATFRFSTNGDQFYPFFNSFNVEVIEPNIVLEKTVEDIAGNDITGAGVNLGQLLDYVLTFQNLGNDNAVNYSIRDILPINVTLDESSLVLPPGVTYTYNMGTREIVFSVPNNLVEESDPEYEIRMRVQVAENCFDFVDACTDQIQNLAYSTYFGEINSAQITDDPSVSDFDSCGFPTPGATNFLLDDLESCDYTRTVQLCGDDVLLDAGDNFDSYVWYRDENADGLIDAGDTVIDDGDPDNDPSTQLVDETGTYIVDKIVADPCKGFQEIIIVELFGNTQSNPITALINDTSNTVEGEILVCPNDGEELPQIFLCGLNDTELIQVNIPDADSIVWEQLDETSCAAATPDCANTDNSCTWNTVATGNDFTAADAGEYRMVINYQNGCFSRFYFNVFKNPLDPQYNSSDIVCTTPGNITVTNIPADYEFQLVDATNNNILVAYNPNPSFDIATNGAYRVEIRQLGVVDGCVFILDNIGILERNFQVDVTTRDTDCNGLGEISISVLDVNPQYYYEISQGGTTVDTFGPSNDNNHTFANLNDGIYDILVTTDDGCNHTEQVVINDVSDLAVNAITTKPIDCTDGIITVTGSGGFPNPDYFYAIWSYNGTDLYPDVASIPGGAYQIGNDFTFTAAEAGDYEFIVVDGNNCTAISNVATIAFVPAVAYTTAQTDETCFGASDGSFTVNVTNSNGYSLSYELTYPDTSTSSNTSGSFTGLPQGNYTLVITQTQGAVSCDFTETFSIGGPVDLPTANAVQVQEYTCLQNGIIEAQNVSGGTAPYEFSLDGINFNSGAGAETFSNLTAGTYNITVRDANGCVFVTNPITIDPLVPPSDLSFSATPPNCPANTSDVTVSVTDGEAPYLFEIIAPAAVAASSISGNTADFLALSPDTYTFRVTDNNGCSYDESFTIDPVTPVQVTGQLISNISCFGATDGEIQYTVSGFSSDYDYNVTGPSTFSGSNTTNNTLTFNGLGVGTYTITVTDNTTNCSDTASVMVNGPAAALTISASEIQPTCLADGSVVLSSSGGWGGNTFTLINPDTSVFGSNATGVFTNLVQTGTYTAEVADVNGCVVSTTFALNAPVAPVLQLTPNDFCYDSAIGLTLTATVTSGGDGNFEYQINGGAFDTNNVFSGLGPGTYTVVVRDGNDCTDNVSLTINPELTLVASAPSITACGASTDVMISAAGGDGNYVYAIVGDGVVPTPGDFGAANPISVTGTGDYDVYVRDNNGGAGFCEAAFDITIVQDPPLAIAPTLTHVTCFGGNDGAISMVASGGEAPYEYSIDNGLNYQVSSSFSNIAAGNYTLAIRDANNCTTTANVTINEPNPLVAEAVLTQDLTCLLNGEITVGSITPTSGGSGSYQYSINGGAWSAPTPGGIVFTGLTNGTYTVVVRDANATSCTLTLPDIIIDPLPVAPAITFNVSYNCDGSGDVTVLPNDPSYTYSLDGGAFQASNLFTNVSVGLHTVTVDYGRSCTTQADVIIQAGQALGSSIISSTNASCNGSADGSITFEVENFDTVNGFEYAVNGGGFSAPQTSSPVTVNGLAAGAYSIEVRDVLDNSCTITLNRTLTEPSPVVAAASIVDVLTCVNGGAIISASASGGTPAYEYQLEDGVGGIIAGFDYATNGSNTLFTGLAAGDYIVRARDVNGCEDPIDTAITIVPPATVTFTTTPTACYSGNSDGTIQVTVTDGNGDYQFSLNSGAWITPTPATATTHTFTGLTAGTYTVDVRDAYGCAGIQQTVTINPALTASAALDADLTCVSAAQITITASGGTAGYTYEWSDDAGATFNSSGFTGNVFNTSTAATYTFRVTDTTAPTACVVTTNAVVITPTETPIITTVNPTNVLCNGDVTGMLDVVIDTSVGVPPYVINVLETNTSTNYGTQTTGLPAGDYEVTITDDKGCVSNPFVVSITEPNVITPNVTNTNLTCIAGGNVLGTITVDAAGGTPTYIYDVTNSDFSVSLSYDTSSGTNDHTFTGLDFGDYTVTVTDANGCQSVSLVTITTGPDVLVTTQGVAGCTPGSGEMLVEAQASNGTLGVGTFYFAIYPAPPFNIADPAWNPEDPFPAPINSHLFTGLTPGVTYSFIVYDTDTNCEYIQEATVPVAATSTLVATIDGTTDITCTGAADGTVDFTVSGYGGTDVDYELFAATTNITTGATGTISGVAGGPESDTMTGLGPGEYYILFTEANGPNVGCVMASANFTIVQSPNLLDVTATSPTNDNCNPNAGVINAVAQFGTAPYEFQYLLNTDPAPTAASAGWVSNTTANVASGDYIVYVKDANDCIQSDAVTVLLDPRPEITLSIVDECVVEGTFQVLVTLTNPGVALAPFQISVNGGAYQNFSFDASNEYILSGLSSGLGQSISVRDVNGCTDIDPLDIQPPLEFTVQQVVELDCDPGAAANAEIEITVTSGSGNYEFEIDGPGANDEARTALLANPFTWVGAGAAGTYNVTVYDLGTTPPNCFQTVAVDVPNAPLPDFTETHQDVTCNGGADGRITLVEVNNGINPLTYTLTPMPGGAVLNGNTFENLPAGTYSVRGTGTNNCFTDIFNIVIDEPAPVMVPAPTIVEFGCASGNNPNNASISISGVVTGGSGTYVIYEFIEEDDPNTIPVEPPVVVQTGSNTTYIETDLAGGAYTINVYDSNGCVGSTTASIQPYDELLTATAAITNPLSCNPGTDGEITISVTSTNSDPTRFEYSIDNGANYQASNVFGGLGAGTYNFLVRHVDTGCIITTSATLVDPNTFTIDVVVLNDVICFGTASGQVTFELLDATYSGPIDWEIYDTNGTPSNFADDLLVTNGSFATNGPTAPIVLSGGDYYVEVTQTNFPQCSNISAFTIASPNAPITANVAVTDITCLGNDGIITITDVQGGWGGNQYYVGTTPPTGPGDYVVSPDFNGLTAGTYEAWVLDSAGCEEMIQNNIVLADPLPITATLQVNNENCTNIEGEIEVVGVSGGQGSNYSYQLIRNGVVVGSPQTSPVFSNLGEGSYEVLVADQWSCTFTTAAELLYDEMNLVATVVKPIDCSASPGGEITITVTGGSGNFEFTATPPVGVPITNNTGIFTGLTADGSYSFLVTDLDTTNPTCTRTIVQELTAPTPVTFAAHSIADVSCNGGADGSITVNLQPMAAGVNDDTPYVYNLYDAAGTTLMAGPQSSPTFTGLTAAFYQVEAISSRLCSLRETVEVQEPTVLTATAAATAFGCNANNTVNTATLTVTAAGGAGGYVYSLDNVNFQSGNTFDIADTGVVQNLTVYVNDANGCSITVPQTIQPINTFTATVAQNIAISCLNPEEVLVSLVDNGHPGNTYSFELLPVGNTSGSLISNPTTNSAVFELTDPGTYTFRITDTATGCYVTTAPYTIAPYDTMEVVATAIAPAICFGDTNGALSIDISGYSGTYNYEVFSQAGVSILAGSGDTSTNPLTINGLSGGNYFVRVTQTNHPQCSGDSNIITIVSPDMPLDATPMMVGNVTCDNNQGEIVVAPDGGYFPYDIVLTNTTTAQVYTANGVDSFVFSGLSAGNFDVTITDNGGCVINRTIALIQPNPITADIDATPTMLTCYGDTNATITAINVLGGEGVYQYQLNQYDPTGTTIAITSGAQSSPVFGNLGAGIYSISVSDGWNCGMETVQVTISEPTDVFANLIQIAPLSCTNAAELQLSASGGTAPYEYSLDGTTYQPMSGGNVHTFSVNAGAFQYYVRDAFGCEAMISNEITVDPVPPLTIDIDDSAAIINCTGEATATIVANTTGGLGNYSFELYGDAALTNLLAGPQASDTFSSLMAGSYFVRVVSGDCVAVSPEVLIVDPMPLQIDRQEFTNVTCSGLDDGTITVEVSGGTGEIFYAITPNLNQFDTENTFTDLAPGVYDVIAQDRNGCFIPFQFTIVEPQPIAADAINIQHEVCVGDADGAFDLTITGGTAPYRTSLNSNNDADYIQDQLSFSNLASGTYVVFIRDAQDCETNVIVEINPGVNLNAAVTPIYTCNGIIPDNALEVTLEDDTVASDVLYALDSTDPADLQLTADFVNITPGSHFLTIVHANGCMNTIDFEIQSFEPLTLLLEQNNINEITAVVSGGSPEYTIYFDDDNNGSDNTYIINRTDIYTVTVIDALGCEVSAEIEMEFIDIEVPNFFTPDGDGMNDYWLPDNLEAFPNVLMIIFDRYGRELYRMGYGDQGWDGIYNNAELPTGDYWYIIKLKGENDDREMVGHFTLYR